MPIAPTQLSGPTPSGSHYHPHFVAIVVVHAERLLFADEQVFSFREVDAIFVAIQPLPHDDGAKAELLESYCQTWSLQWGIVSVLAQTSAECCATGSHAVTPVGVEAYRHERG